IVMTEAAAYHAATLDRVPERYTPSVRLRLEMGRYILAEDYVRALRCREMLKREVDAALAGVDALILPTLPIPAPRIGTTSVEIHHRDLSIRNATLRLTQLFDLTGHPAIALPTGHSADGLPCSAQLVARDTEWLVQVALACEPYISGVAPPRS